MNYKEYNGWTNYETWCVHLWLTNDQETDSYWRENAESFFVPDEKHDVFTPSESARYRLADTLKNQITDAAQVDELQGTMYQDLLGAAISEVNWPEIANAFLEDVQGYEYCDCRPKAVQS